MRMFVTAMWLSSCVIGDARYPTPRDLTPAWMVDKVRVLGIRAEPPEVRVGDVVHFEVLLANPDDEEFATIWLACPVEGGGTGFGCELDLGTLDLTTATPEELSALGFIGIEPYLPPVYIPDDSLLDALSEEERPEGAYVLVQVTALPLDTLENEVEELDFNEVEVAYKRLVVSEAATPNRNPSTGHFRVDKTVVEEGSIVHLERGEPYELSVMIPDEDVERYDFVTSSGEVEQRLEEPYAAWFSTGGELLEEVTLHPFTQADWISPKRSGESGTWFVVVRDRRGGVAWETRHWIVD